MFSPKIKIAFVIIVLVALGTYLNYYKHRTIGPYTTPVSLPDYSFGSVFLKDKIFSVYVADTDRLRVKGLSGMKSLDPHDGMLFVFDRSDLHGFWMKDMKFDIDIIWIDENMKIIHIERSVSPDTYPKVFKPSSPGLYVLEVNAGVAKVLGIQVGDIIKVLKN